MEKVTMIMVNGKQVYTKHKVASGLIKLYLKHTHMNAWTSAWDTVYYESEEDMNDEIMTHELKHIEQMEERGKIPFIFSYLWESIKHGYRGNRYEVEAYDTKKDL